MPITKKQAEQFMLESNKIEGELRLNPGDLEAVDFLMENNIDCEGHILYLHSILGKYLKKPWVGKFREVQVYIGNHTPPKAEFVPMLMDEWLKKYNYIYKSYEAHHEFQMIHPFQDLNGRVGRLLWLKKALNEGYKFDISFLHKMYYQSLDHFRK